MVRVSKVLYTDGFLFREVRDFYEKFGRPPTAQEYKRSATARQRFGSWNNFIEKAGLLPRTKHK